MLSSTMLAVCHTPDSCHLSCIDMTQSGLLPLDCYVTMNVNVCMTINTYVQRLHKLDILITILLSSLT